MFVAAMPNADRFLFLNTTDPTTNRRKRILFCLLLGHKVVMSLRLSDPSPIFFSKLRLIVSNCWKKSRLCLLGTCDLIRAPCPCLTGLNFFKFNDHHQIWVLWGSFSMSKGAISKRNTIAKQTSSTFVIIHVLAHCNFVML